MTREEVKQAQIHYMATLAVYESRKKLVEQIKSRTLAENNYKEEETGERITNHQSDFMMNESDFKEYCQQNYRYLLDEGIVDVPDAETTADYKQWHELRLAEKKLFDTFISISPQAQAETLQLARTHWKQEIKQQAIAIMLKLDARTIPAGLLKITA